MPALYLVYFLAIITHDFLLAIPSSIHLTFLISIGNKMITSCSEELVSLTITQVSKPFFTRQGYDTYEAPQSTISLGKHNVFMIFRAQVTNKQTDK